MSNDMSVFFPRCDAGHIAYNTMRCVGVKDGSRSTSHFRY